MPFQDTPYNPLLFFFQLELFLSDGVKGIRKCRAPRVRRSRRHRSRVQISLTKHRRYHEAIDVYVTDTE